jgi:hypothetical protein
MIPGPIKVVKDHQYHHNCHYNDVFSYQGIGAILCATTGTFPQLVWKEGKTKTCFQHSLDTLRLAMLTTQASWKRTRAMKTRYVQTPHLLTIIDPQEICSESSAKEHSDGVERARWKSHKCCGEEFVFAQSCSSRSRPCNKK